MKIIDESGLIVRPSDERFEDLYLSTAQYNSLTIGTKIKGKKNQYVVVDTYIDCSSYGFNGEGKSEVTLQIAYWQYL